LPLYLTLDSDPGTAIKDFVTTALLYQVVLGVIVGTVLGYLFNKIMRFAESRGYVGPDSYAIQFVSLSLFTIGLVTIIGSDDLLAAFAAG
jgi:sodium/hydrogen antiporter